MPEDGTMTLADNATDIEVSSVNASHRGSYSGSTLTFYISVFAIWGPGTLSNLLAMMFFILDMKKAVFPAIFLLFVLCVCDLCAVLSSWSYHILLRYVNISYPICASTAFTFTFFNISASVTNAIMAVDRILAICYPFFYKTNVEVKTWVRVCLIAAILIAIVSAFPFTGLGDVMSLRGRTLTCDSFSYRPEPTQRVFGAVFGLTGVACILTIFVGNSLVIKTLLTLNRRVTCVEATNSTDLSEGTSTSTRATPFEIAFAKLMICLAVVYLVCGAPMQILVLLQAFNTDVSPAAVGYIHLVAGFLYTVDPMVYILIRKVNRKCLSEILCKCCAGWLEPRPRPRSRPPD